MTDIPTLHKSAVELAQAVLTEHPDSIVEIAACLAILAIKVAGDDPLARGAVTAVLQGFVDGMLLEMESRRPGNLN